MAIDRSIGSAVVSEDRRLPPAASRLLVPLDGSEASTRALPVAKQLADRLGVSVAIIDCLPPSLPIEPEEAWLAERAARLEAPVADAAVHVTEQAVQEILATAASVPGTVVCLASHARPAAMQLLLGSVATELVRASSTTLVVGPRARAPRSLDVVQICIDGTPHSRRTIEVGAAWSEALGATPWVTHVVDDHRLPEDELLVGDGVVVHAAARLRSLGLAAEWDVLHGGYPAEALVRWAGGNGTGLLVAGRHDRSGADGLFGSALARVLASAPCPVLVVGPDRPA